MNAHRIRKTPSVRGPFISGLLGLLVLLVGFGSWALTARIAGAVVAHGRIVVERNRQVVQHPEGGVVEAIAVRDGDRVRPGDLLLQLDRSDPESQLAMVEAELFELIARRGRLEAERDGRDRIVFDPLLQKISEGRPEVAGLMQIQRGLLRARLDTAAREVQQLRKRRSQVSDQIAGIGAEQVSLTTQRALISRELSGQQSLLDRGLAPAAKVLALQRESARLDGQSGALAAAVASARGQITEIDLEILKLRSRRRELAVAELSVQSYRELERLEERRALLLRLASLEIRAPVEGIVHGLAINGPRAVLRPAQPVLYLVPQDRPLVVHAVLNPAQVDRVYPGQPATLRFPALEQRRSPALEGRVRHLSADTFMDEATGQNYFRAELVLGGGEAARLPEDAHLKPGMPVEVYIRTGDRAPLSYLLKPLVDYFIRAMRE